VEQGEVTRNVFNADSRILEINSKSGLYPLYMTYGIYRTRLAADDPMGLNPTPTLEQQLALWDKTLAENIFVICKTPMAKSITKRTLAGFRKAKVNTRYFEDLINQIINKPTNFIDKVKLGKTYWKANNNDNMKFNAIVSNPPYMEMDGGAQASAKPIYNNFVEIAKKINPQFMSLIMPSRWYSGGKGLDEFRDNMLNDKRIAILHDFLNPEQVFPKTNIRGGICYFLWNNNYDNEQSLIKVVTHQINANPITVYRTLKSEHSDTFIRHGIAISIVNKVSNYPNFESFSKTVSSRKPFGLDGQFINDSRCHSSVEGLINPIICYGKKKIGYVEKEEIKIKKDWIDRYKVFTPYANNIGTELNDDNLNSFVGEPGSISTETYLVIGANLNLDRISADNLTIYFKTKFLRFQLSIAKASQHATSKTYQFVPLQDFTSASDLDWSQSVPDIDRQLYAKYGLSDEEKAFIEGMIKGM
jgi:hypothetical protein